MVVQLITQFFFTCIMVKVVKMYLWNLVLTNDWVIDWTGQLYGPDLKKDVYFPYKAV